MSTRIVVLDAEPVVSRVMANILERAGYVVAVVATVQAAIEIIDTTPPDLVVTNVYLPGITGREAMRLLKSKRPQLPVLMVSGLPDEGIIHDWAGVEGFDTFPKPFKPNELVEKVASMMKREQ